MFPSDDPGLIYYVVPDFYRKGQLALGSKGKQGKLRGSLACHGIIQR